MKKSDANEINFDDEDEMDVEEYMENLEKINDDFLNFNSKIVNNPV